MDGAARKWFTEIRTREPRGPPVSRVVLVLTLFFYYCDHDTHPGPGCAAAASTVQ